MDNKQPRQPLNYKLKAFIPLFVFLIFYIGSGIYFTINGCEGRPWGQMPRQTAIFFAVIVACFMDKTTTINEKIGIFIESARKSGLIMMVIIFLLAGAFQGVCKAMGGSTSFVNLALSVIPARFVLPGIFLVSAIIGTSTGTSSGTLAIIGPVAVGIATNLGAPVELYLASCWGGCLFGDNLSVISDTTIAACSGAGCDMKDKFRMNFAIALPAAIVTMIVLFFMGGAAPITDELPYSVVTIIPYIYVLVAAIAGMNVYLVLASGIVLAGIIGIASGNFSFIKFCSSVGSGMEGMMSMSVLALLIGGLIGLIQYFGGIQWVVELISSKVKTRKGAEYAIGIICAFLDFATITNTITIIIAAPMTKQLCEKYHIDPKRNASLLDIFACIFMAFLPHGNFMLTMTGFYPDLNPLSVLKYGFYSIFFLISVIITIQFGLGRTTEEKAFEAKKNK